MDGVANRLGRQLDEAGVFNSLHGVFDSLVRKFGVEKAVRILVKVIFENV